jgi:hypothetical protein
MRAIGLRQMAFFITFKGSHPIFSSPYLINRVLFASPPQRSNRSYFVYDQ